MEYYWELVLSDGTKVLIPPTGVKKVKQLLEDKKPIPTRTALIMPFDVKAFHVTNKPLQTVPLLDTAAQVFGADELNEDGSIVSRWVKKAVTQREYQSHYAKLPGYRVLENDGSHVYVAMFLPVHSIDTNSVQYCSAAETERLERTRKQRAT